MLLLLPPLSCWMSASFKFHRNDSIQQSAKIGCTCCASLKYYNWTQIGSCCLLLANTPSSKSTIFNHLGLTNNATPQPHKWPFANGIHGVQWPKWRFRPPCIFEIPGVDYCSKGHACHTNATCLNLNTKYTCTCRSGFHGDGYDCSGKCLLIFIMTL